MRLPPKDFESFASTNSATAAYIHSNKSLLNQSIKKSAKINLKNFLIVIKLQYMAFYNDAIFWIEVEKIKPNPYQPRREFDEARLNDLASSIRQYGILQPLVVTRREIVREDGGLYSEYELIAGERRLRASKIAGLSQVPVIIRNGDQTEQEKLELAIIENLQREDLN